MRPLSRQLLIGILVSALAVVGLGAAWWTTTRDDGSLASRIPAEAVIAYATANENAAAHDALSELYGSLPAAPEPQPGTEAVALVRSTDGAVGWLSLVRQNGRTRVHGSSPALEPLLHDPRPRLANDPTFRTLRADQPDWLYVTSAGETGVGDVLAPFLRLDEPIALRPTADGFAVRVPLRSTPRVDDQPARPTVVLPSMRHVLRLPSWDALAAIGSVLTDDAATVAETLAATFLADLAPGLSLRYDVSPLLHGPSTLQLGDGFAFEGTGSSPGETDRVLRVIHERFGDAKGSADVRTVTVEGYALNVLTGADASATTERTDGAWTVLETRAGDAVLLSARDGARFVVTDDETAFRERADTDLAFAGSQIEWTEGALDLVRPFWPDRGDNGQSLQVGLTSDQGYVEWTIGGI